MGRCAWWVTIAICFKALAALQVADMEIEDEGKTLEHTEEKMELPLRDFMKTNPTEVDSLPVFEEDIVLTASQMQAIKERKAIRNESYHWPEGIVPYVFGDSDVSQSAVLAGIHHWEQHTCLRFQQTSNTSQPHLRFVDGGCYSYVGMQDRNGQDVDIGSGCTSLNRVVHMLGHAIGFYHEHTRPDRDKHVVINYDNIRESRKPKFDKFLPSEVNTYGVPYDHGSIMGYRSTSSTINGGTTIAPRNPLLQPFMVRPDELSHRDKHLANRMYGCIKMWRKKCGVKKHICRNGGYFGPNCRCVCPPGTSGCRCQRRTGSYYSNIGNTCTQKVWKPTTLKSPSYPSNYPSGQCVIWIVAPKCCVPRITFSDFSMRPKSDSCYGNLCCYYDALEIRTTSKHTGSVYCGTDISPGQSITSNTRRIILYHRARSDNEYLGWSFNVTFLRQGC